MDFGVVEVVHGSWSDDAKGGRSIHCTNCGALVNERVNSIQIQEEKRDGKKKS